MSQFTLRECQFQGACLSAKDVGERHSTAQIRGRLLAGCLFKIKPRLPHDLFLIKLLRAPSCRASELTSKIVELAVVPSIALACISTLSPGGYG